MRNYLVFESTKKSSTETINLHEWFIYEKEMEDHELIHSLNIEIYSKNYVNEDKIKIGYIKGTFFHVDNMNDLNCQIPNMFTTTGFSDLYKQFFILGSLKPQFASLTNDIFFLEEIYIEPNYRKYGYGTETLSLLQKILMYLFHFDPALIVTKPITFEYQNQTKTLNENIFLIKRIKKFLEKSEFTLTNSFFYKEFH